MSTLVDWEIAEWAEAGGVTPFDPELINPASINLRVGTTAKIESMSGIIDLDLGAYSRRMPYIVPGGCWILCDVMEAISIPPTMEGTVVLRSSAARRGWDHAMAGFVDPGYGYKNPSKGVILQSSYLSEERRASINHCPLRPMVRRGASAAKQYGN